jgi:hypothetical protein
MSDIVGRLRASVIYDAVSGSSCERHICEGQMSEAADEIERLRGELAAVLTHYADRNANKDERIDPVGTHILVDVEKWAAKDAEIEWLRERIEELDQSLVALDEHQADKHFITEEQIDRAWKLNPMAQYAGGCMRELGIERCGWCNGGQTTILREDNSYTGFKTITCPDCHGKGWVIASQTIDEKRST